MGEEKAGQPGNGPTLAEEVTEFVAEHGIEHGIGWAVDEALEIGTGGIAALALPYESDNPGALPKEGVIDLPEVTVYGSPPKDTVDVHDLPDVSVVEIDVHQLPDVPLLEIDVNDLPSVPINVHDLPNAGNVGSGGADDPGFTGPVRDFGEVDDPGFNGSGRDLGEVDDPGFSGNPAEGSGSYPSETDTPAGDGNDSSPHDQPDDPPPGNGDGDP